ncbi:uncharacterized protein LOC122065562 [Macadamia integrifolia]|uniref:uncharacterized protein LOC122065562 n=1 Tax=Macadamia integrifolia TaxID=60698 RepID=UPI001C4F9701|nr:uncharacterized protein LOC122065562 [Macadamia integrifolia]
MRRMKNSFKYLKTDDGTLISDKAHLEEYVTGYYGLFHKGIPLTDHMDLLQCIPKVLEERDRGRLDGIPSDTEIKGAVWDLDPDSAPGPAGFPEAFYKSCWDIISSDVCRAIKWFFKTSFMPYGINNNFLVLIPKTEEALSLDKFRPLCMGNFFYKIISKVLTMRLTRVLPKIIFEEQGAFQKGKIIHSNISLASELANMMFASTRGGGMGLKIDIQKVFETISWNFIFHILRRFGFFEKWISWIYQILASARISVLLNGGPVGYLSVERGLRQGDPILPMLFIIAKEVLCRGLSELLANKSIKTLSGPRGAITLTHILFVDDVFIFSNASIRLMPLLPHLVSDEQRAFQKGKIISSNISLASELANLMHSAVRGGGMGLKLDLQKAYDSLLSVLVNGEPMRFFPVGRGLRQGDPISPFLFILAEEAFCRSLKLLVRDGKLKSLPDLEGAFQKGKIISFNISLASELANLMHSAVRGGGMGLKLDVQKLLLSSSRLSVLVNGDPMGFSQWAEIKHEESSMSKFFRGRFLKADGSLKSGHISSSICPGIKKVWNFVALNEQWTVGNGHKIDFWKDRWLDHLSIEELLLNDGGHKGNLKAKVCDFIHNSRWDFPQVASNYMKDITNKANSIYISGMEDECHWRPSSAGVFSIKSAWEACRRSSPKAIITGIEAANQFGVQSLWIECDSVIVVHLLQKKTIPWKFRQRWINCLPYLERVEWKITHCFREANSVADILSKFAAHFETSLLVTSWQALVKMDLDMDALDHSRYRLL